MFRLTYVTSFREYAQRSCLVINTVELCYNDLGLCDISAITLYILRYGLIPQCHVLFCLASYDVHTSTTSDITTLPVILSITIFQEVDYLQDSAISSSLRGQAPYAFRCNNNFFLQEREAKQSGRRVWIFQRIQLPPLSE